MFITIDGKEYLYRKEDRFTKGIEVPFRGRLTKSYLKANNLPEELSKEYVVFFKPSDLLFKTDRSITFLIDENESAQSQTFINKTENYMFRLMKVGEESFDLKKISFKKIMDYSTKRKISYKQTDKLFCVDQKIVLLTLFDKKNIVDGVKKLKRYYLIHGQEVENTLFKKNKHRIVKVLAKENNELEFKKLIIRLKLEN